MKKLKKLSPLFFSLPMIEWEDIVNTKFIHTNERVVVLLEGLDCSGKKTLARSLVERLSIDGYNAHIHLGPFGPRWYNRLISLVTLNAVPNIFRSIIFSLEPFIQSKLPPQEFQGGVLIQISSSLRSIGYSKILGNKFRNFCYTHIPIRLPQFDLIYHITADYQIRKERHIAQSISKENADDINTRFFSEVFSQDLDAWLKTKLCDIYSESFKGSFDTSTIHSDIIAKQILHDLYRKKKYPFVHRNWRYQALYHGDLAIKQVYIWILDRAGNVLIVSKNGEDWHMPGGKPEDNETIFATALRETMEEIGLDLSKYTRNMQGFGYYEITEGRTTQLNQYELSSYIQQRLFLILDSLVNFGFENLKRDGEEIRFAKTVPLNELGKYIPWMLGREEFNSIKSFFYENNNIPTSL